MATSVRFLVDGFNVYHAIREVERRQGHDCRWLDIRGLCASARQLIGPQAHLGEVHYFSNIYASGELTEGSTIRKSRTVQRKGSQDVRRSIAYSNLDAVISVGYRVNSRQATQFRIWATRTLKESIGKGFVLDDERRFYLKITDKERRAVA
ncbi:MAG: hypothetical protein FJX74_13655 [Armatimonadetes bacterium]|nr:hypothetical protein [Armatimonadota bacterium]